MKKVINGFGLVSFMAFPEIASGDGPILDCISKILMDPFFSMIEITHINDNEKREEVKKALDVLINNFIHT